MVVKMRKRVSCGGVFFCHVREKKKEGRKKIFCDFLVNFYEKCDKMIELLKIDQVFDLYR
jgi:hypothetical protein